MNNLSEIKVVFDSESPGKTCNTIHSIHSLIFENNEEFCCQVHEGNEVIINVNKENGIEQYITRTIFPHILHVVVNTNNTRTTDWSIVNLIIIIIFSILSVTIILYVKSYWKKRQQEVDAENVVIHCIQNNLKTTSNEFRPLTPPNKKLCNTFSKNSDDQIQKISYESSIKKIISSFD